MVAAVYFFAKANYRAKQKKYVCYTKKQPTSAKNLSAHLNNIAWNGVTATKTLLFFCCMC